MTALLRRAYDVCRVTAPSMIESTDDEQETPESILPVLEEGSSVTFTDVNAEQHFTQPPARYTEASLVRTLEEKGIGRPSTYAPTITTIISRGYVSREKKRLYPTELGHMVTDVMPEYFRPDRGYGVYRPDGGKAGRGGRRARWNGSRRAARLLSAL